MENICTVPTNIVPCVTHLTNPVSAKWYPWVRFYWLLCHSRGRKRRERKRREGRENRPYDVDCALTTTVVYALDHHVSHLKTGRPAKFHGQIADNTSKSGQFQAAMPSVLNVDFSQSSHPFFILPIRPCYLPSNLPCHQFLLPVVTGCAAASDVFWWPWWLAGNTCFGEFPMTPPTFPPILTTLNLNQRSISSKSWWIGTFEEI